jgi:hypothetical protein
MASALGEARMKIKIYTTYHPEEDEHVVRVCIGEARSCSMITYANANTVQFAGGPAFEHAMPEGRVTLTLEKVYFLPEYLSLLVWETVRLQVCIEREEHDIETHWAPIEFNDCYIRSFERRGPDNPQEQGALYDRMELIVGHTFEINGGQRKPMETDAVKAWLARWARR